MIFCFSVDSLDHITHLRFLIKVKYIGGAKCSVSNFHIQGVKTRVCAILITV